MSCISAQQKYFYSLWNRNKDPQGTLEYMFSYPLSIKLVTQEEFLSPPMSTVYEMCQSFILSRGKRKEKNVPGTG
jgi:hypothetical protein